MVKDFTSCCFTSPQAPKLDKLVEADESNNSVSHLWGNLQCCQPMHDKNNTKVLVLRYIFGGAACYSGTSKVNTKSIMCLQQWKAEAGHTRCRQALRGEEGVVPQSEKVADGDHDTAARAVFFPWLCQRPFTGTRTALGSHDGITVTYSPWKNDEKCPNRTWRIPGSRTASEYRVWFTITSLIFIWTRLC